MRRLIPILVVILAVLASAAPASAQQLKNVAVSRVGPGYATIIVKTDIPSDVSVEYGTAPGVYSMSAAVSSGLLRHEIQLNNLPSSSRIFYRVTVTDSANPSNTMTYPEKSFSSFKDAGQPYRYTVVGDNRPPGTSPILPPANWAIIVAQMNAASPDLLLHAGDIILAQPGDTALQNEEKYDAFFSVTMDMAWSTPFYMAAGNHERLWESVGMNGYRREFTLPENDGLDAEINGELYYSFDHGDTHFVVLCSEMPGEYGLVTGYQLQWLEGDLAANAKPWTVVVVHQPLYGNSGVGSHAADPWSDPGNTVGQQNRAYLTSLFEQNGVDVVFQGHDHYYLRHARNGIQYMVTGGAGSPLYNLPLFGPGDVFGARAFHHVRVDETANSMALAVVDTTGAVLESFTLGTPSLGLTTLRVYWEDYAAYQARELSVDYMMDNRGDGDALTVAIVHAQATNGVFPITPMPLAVADLEVGQDAPLTMRYLVPFGVNFFRTTSYAACDGWNGASFAFPGPPPGI